MNPTTRFDSRRKTARCQWWCCTDLKPNRNVLECWMPHESCPAVKTDPSLPAASPQSGKKTPGGASAALFLFEFEQNQFGNGFERVEHAFAAFGRGLVLHGAALVE